MLGITFIESITGAKGAVANGDGVFVVDTPSSNYFMHLVVASMGTIIAMLVATIFLMIHRPDWFRGCGGNIAIANAPVILAAADDPDDDIEWEEVHVANEVPEPIVPIAAVMPEVNNVPLVPPVVVVPAPVAASRLRANTGTQSSFRRRCSRSSGFCGTGT